jgi:peroxiredoxin
MRAAKTEQLLKAGIGLLLGVFVYLIYDSFTEKIVKVGDKAPGFAITTDTGRTISVPDFGGKLLVLNFWATWCPPCVDEMPSLDAFSRQMSSEGVVVLGISVDRDAQVYRNFLSRANISFLTARDPENRINADYGTFKYPETYIIGSDGKVLEKIIGDRRWTDPQMLEMVRSLLRG